VPSRVHPISGCQEEELSPAFSAFAMLAAGTSVGTGKESVADERIKAGTHLLGLSWLVPRTKPMAQPRGVGPLTPFLPRRARLPRASKLQEHETTVGKRRQHSPQRPKHATPSWPMTGSSGKCEITLGAHLPLTFHGTAWEQRLMQLQLLSPNHGTRASLLHRTTSWSSFLELARETFKRPRGSCLRES
jgi:hypothetical protein